MSNIKKIIGVVLALVMALSCASIAFAAEGDSYKLSISAPATVNAGETATVEVKLTANYPVSTMSIPVFFDKTKVEVVSATAGTALDPKLVKVAGQGDNTEVEKYYKDANLSEDNYDLRALIYVAGVGDTVKAYNNETVMTITIKAKDNASGDALITFGDTMKTSTNQTGSLYVGKNSSGTTTVDSLAETIDAGTLENATITIKGSAAGDPVLTGINGGVIGDSTTSIDMTGYVYGIPVGTTDFTGYFSVENGSFTVTGTGTGAILQVYDNTGAAYGDPYTVIIFGDVDGSNTVSSDDYIAVKAATMTTPLTGAFAIAGDVDVSGSIASDDYIAVKAATMTTPLSQNPFA